MATVATQDASDLLAGGDEQWGEELEGIEEEQPVVAASPPPPPPKTSKSVKRKSPSAATSKGSESVTKKSRTVNGGRKKRAAAASSGKRKKQPQPIVEEEESSSSEEGDSGSSEEEESSSSSSSKGDSDSDSESEEEEEEEAEDTTFRHYKVPIVETIDKERGKVVRVYHTAQDQKDGFGFNKGVPRPLVDAAGAKRYAEGGGAFIRTASITKHMKNRAGIESMEKKAAEKVARFGEDVAAALTSQVVLFTKSRKQKTISPEDVQNAATLMGIDNLVRC